LNASAPAVTGALQVVPPELDPELDPELELELEPALGPELDPVLDPELDPGLDPELDPEGNPQWVPELAVGAGLHPSHTGTRASTASAPSDAWRIRISRDFMFSLTRCGVLLASPWW
jgi:hypothetical protein